MFIEINARIVYDDIIYNKLDVYIIYFIFVFRIITRQK